MENLFLALMLFVIFTNQLVADSVCRKTTSVCEICQENTTQNNCCVCPFPLTKLFDKCFFTVRASLTHDTAVQRCASINATLASIRNSTENELLRAFSTMGTACTVSNTNNCLMLIGLSSINGNLSWANGDAVTYTNFATSPTNNTCTGLYVDVQGSNQGMWASLSCQGSVTMALCEREPDCGEE